jgi:hypothetical protein
MSHRPEGKPTVTIANWAFYNGMLSGNVYGHPRFADGDFVCTSQVQSILKDAPDVFILETRNTNYLIEPAPTDDQRELFVHLPITEDENA